MNEDQFGFLTRVVESIGPSGFEQPAQKVWRERVEAVAESVTTDRMGNAVAALNSAANPRVMIEAHIDEIGFIVKYIDDEGFVYFSPIGGFDASTLPGNRVRILGKQGPVLGVIGRKPIHFLKEEERNKAPDIATMWIDLGVKNRSEAEALVGIGDAGGRCTGIERLHGSILAGNSFDDRVCCYVIAEVFRNLAKSDVSAGVFAVSAVQEEIGLRGARVAAYAVHPDIAVALDVIPTADHPFSSKTDLGEIAVGKGPVLTRGASTNPRVYERLVEAARSTGVAFQIEGAPAATRTDEDAIQLARGGVATGLLSIPTRYLHTASEVLSTEDVDGAVTILTRFVQEIQGEVDLIP